MKTMSISNVLLLLMVIISSPTLAQGGKESRTPGAPRVVDGEGPGSATDSSNARRDPHTGTIIIPSSDPSLGAMGVPQQPAGIGERGSGQTQRTIDRSAGQTSESSTYALPEARQESSEQARKEMATSSDDAHLPKGLIGVSLLVASKRIGDSTSLYIDRVHPEGPAQQAGIKHGDEVVSVNGETVTGKTYQQVLHMMRGEAGTEVKLGIKREGDAHHSNCRR